MPCGAARPGIARCRPGIAASGLRRPGCPSATRSPNTTPKASPSLCASRLAPRCSARGRWWTCPLPARFAPHGSMSSWPIPPIGCCSARSVGHGRRSRVLVDRMQFLTIRRLLTVRLRGAGAVPGGGRHAGAAMSLLLALIAQILHGALMLAAGPLVVGFIRLVKARLLGRAGPSPLQPWRDLARLFRKQPVVAEGASWLFRAAPVRRLCRHFRGRPAGAVLRAGHDHGADRRPAGDRRVAGAGRGRCWRWRRWISAPPSAASAPAAPWPSRSSPSPPSCW